LGVRGAAATRAEGPRVKAKRVPTLWPVVCAAAGCQGAPTIPSVPGNLQQYGAEREVGRSVGLGAVQEKVFGENPRTREKTVVEGVFGRRSRCSG
jgi:hypothetical protein